jgi:hypothetical protein
VGATADPAADPGKASRLGLKPGQIAQEYGYDDDVDHDLRDAIEELTGHEMVDEDSDEIVDVVVLWWREDDGDLVDALINALGVLAEGGVIWLLTPKSGRDGHVEPSEIDEAAPTAGLHATSTVSACRDWSGTRLATPKGRR